MRLCTDEFLDRILIILLQQGERRRETGRGGGSVGGGDEATAATAPSQLSSFGCPPSPCPLPQVFRPHPPPPSPPPLSSPPPHLPPTTLPFVTPRQAPGSDHVDQIRATDRGSAPRRQADCRAVRVGRKSVHSRPATADFCRQHVQPTARLRPLPGLPVTPPRYKKKPLSEAADNRIARIAAAYDALEEDENWTG